ncbi:MAG: radical SAM protein [Nanoarchaeota archaeon]|nr:radical SAM protein [Nanoarchaeota archaeon]
MVSFGNTLWHLKFLRKKPRVLLRIIKDYFYVRVLRKNRLRTIDFAVSYRCNANCEMCSAKFLMSNKKNKGKKELTPDEIIDTWKKAVKLGAIHINITGGEPTIRPPDELVKIIKGINKENALISLVTNSILMTKENLTRYVDAGLDTIQLSLESLDEKTHDKIRRTPSNYKKLMEVFRWAKELKLNICLSTVITYHNFEEVKKIMKFSKEHNVFTLLNPISSSGEVAGDFSRSIADKKKEYYQLLKKGHVRADTVLNFRGGSGCPAGTERISITPYGEVMTCPHVQVSYGNIRNEPLEKIYKRISKFPLLKDFDKDCRHVFNEDYIEKILKPTHGTFELPIDIYDHPITKEKEIKEYLEKTK